MSQCTLNGDGNSFEFWRLAGHVQVPRNVVQVYRPRGGTATYTHTYGSTAPDSVLTCASLQASPAGLASLESALAAMQGEFLSFTNEYGTTVRVVLVDFAVTGKRTADSHAAGIATCYRIDFELTLRQVNV